MARKIRKHALPGDIACCHGPGIKALNCCDTALFCRLTRSQLQVFMQELWERLEYIFDDITNAIHFVYILVSMMLSQMKSLYQGGEY